MVWNEWFWSKNKEWKIHRPLLTLSSKLKCCYFAFLFCRLRAKKCTKCVPHVLVHDSFLTSKPIILLLSAVVKPSGYLTKRRRYRTMGLVSKNNSSACAFYILLHFLPSSPKWQFEMTKFKVLWRTLAHDNEFSVSLYASNPLIPV